MIFTVRDTRSGAVVWEVLGADYAGTVSCDGYAVTGVIPWRVYGAAAPSSIRIVVGRSAGIESGVSAGVCWSR